MPKNKYSIFPIQNKEVWDAFKKHEMSFWTAEELDFTADIPDLLKLNKDELFFIKNILAFFAQSDGIVNENLATRFYNDVDMAEAKAFYAMQILIETIHAEVYGLLIDTYVKDEVEKDDLFNAIETIPVIKKKAEWAIRWIGSNGNFAKRLVAFAAVEGIFFSGAFCSIFWLRKRGLLPGLSAANDLISRDEGLHWIFATLLYKTLKLKISYEEFREIIIEAVNLEKEFICESLPVSLIGMNSKLMSEYIEYTADRVSQNFGFNKIYKTENPFDFMKLIDLENKTNFFEKRVTEYQKVGDRSLNFDTEF